MLELSGLPQPSRPLPKDIQEPVVMKMRSIPSHAGAKVEKSSRSRCTMGTVNRGDLKAPSQV